MADADTWCVDSSVVLRAVREGSPSARTWFNTAAAVGARFVSSRLLELESVRVLKRQMAVAAAHLGFDVLDPVTDGPGKGPVTDGL